MVFFCSLSVVKDKITWVSEKQKWCRIGRNYGIRWHNFHFTVTADFLVYRAKHLVISFFIGR